MVNLLKAGPLRFKQLTVDLLEVQQMTLGHNRNFCLRHIFSNSHLHSTSFSLDKAWECFVRNSNHFKLRHKATETRLVGTL